MSRDLYMCPKSGMPCDIAQWTADHIEIQYHVPAQYRSSATRAILSTTMRCEGSPDDCEPSSPGELDQKIALFNEALNTDGKQTALDERGVELQEKAKDPIDRALMWTLLLPEALVESVSDEPEVRQIGLEELTRLRDVLGNFYKGNLVYPTTGTELEIFFSLTSISGNFLASAPDNDKLVAASEDVSDKFADRYIMKVDDPSLAALHEHVRRGVQAERAMNNTGGSNE